MEEICPVSAKTLDLSGFGKLGNVVGEAGILKIENGDSQV